MKHKLEYKYVRINDGLFVAEKYMANIYFLECKSFMRELFKAKPNLGVVLRNGEEIGNIDNVWFGPTSVIIFLDLQDDVPVGSVGLAYHGNSIYPKEPFTFDEIVGRDYYEITGIEGVSIF